MVCGYSRWLSGLLLPTRTAADLFAGWWRHLDMLGAVPRVLVWDGESAVGRWRGGRSELTAECQAFRGVLGAKVLVLRPADPEAKGIIERAHDYLERSFLPGRTFSSPADFNAQLGEWLRVVNRRPRRVLGCAPTDRVGADRQAMLSLPPVASCRGGAGSPRPVAGAGGPGAGPAGRAARFRGRNRPAAGGVDRAGPGAAAVGQPRSRCP